MNQKDTQLNHRIQSRKKSMVIKVLSFKIHKNKQEDNFGCCKQSNDLELSKNLILNSNLCKPTASMKKIKIYYFLSNNVKSQNLIFKFNDYFSIKLNQKTPSFKSVVIHKILA